MPEPLAHPPSSAKADESVLPTLVDGHVHFHSGFEMNRFLDAAAENFRAAAARLEIVPAVKLLLLADPGGHDSFERLQEQAGEATGRWSLTRTVTEPAALRASAGEETLVLVSGCQIVSAEGIEFLALAWAGSLPDGLPLRVLLARAARESFIPVVPWGFGKWRLRRGRLLRQLLEEQDPSSILLGDNGCRPAKAPRHPLFAKATKRGIRILPGTDPLPLRGEVGRPASFGALIELPSSESPVSALRSALLDPETPLRPYGKGQALWPFLVQQVRMQLRKRGWRKRR